MAPAAADPADPARTHAAAARGTATPATALPHAAQIQRAFGGHDISGIQAHTGGAAAASAAAIGARAYATGDHVVLGDSADLHTVAHEAAHVVQQRGGVQLKGGIGEAGDPYEQHADAVADRVVRGESAESLLGPVSAASASPGASLQRVILAHNNSHNGLKAIFDQLCQSVDSIGALTDQIGQAVTVRFDAGDELDGRRACFEVDSNTIILDPALANNLGDLRHYLLIELNHARLGAAPVAAPHPDNPESFDQEDLTAFSTAIDALRVEYHEWISVYLTHLETVDANMALGQHDQANAVTPRFAPAFAIEDQGFFDFATYLDMQVQSGHTAAYDPASREEDWVGEVLMGQAQQDHGALLTITHDEHLQYGLLLLQNPAAMHTALAQRTNPFAGADGKQLLSATVPKAMDL